MEQTDAITFILEAPEPILFPKGKDPGIRFKRLVKFCHPDSMVNVSNTNLRNRAERAFKRLSDLYEKRNGKPKDPFKPQIIGKWVIEEPLAKGDIADLYVAMPTISWPNPNQKAVFKIVRSPKDNDLMKAEADAITKMHADARSPVFKTYIPELYETFTASGRRANVLAKPAGYHSLTEIMNLYPDGLDFRHIVWMGNRLLSALGFAHHSGVIHGAVLPQHLLYHPATHGLVIVGWGQSVTDGPIKVIVNPAKFIYPKEVMAKYLATPALDIYMAMQVLRQAGQTPPKRMQPLFDWAHAESPSARPQSAWELQDGWSELAKQEFGKPKYLELKLPVM